jgi:hypothetical protein
LEKPREPINGVLVEDELIAEAMRPGLDLASSGLGQDVVKRSGDRHLIGMGVGGARAWLGSAGDLGFERPDRPPALDRAPREQAPPAVIGFGQGRLAVPLGQSAFIE